MNYLLTGSLGHVAAPLASALVRTGHRVTLVSGTPGRADAITSLGARPAIGSLEDAAFLASACRGADAMFTMVPQECNCQNIKEFIAGIGQAYAIAIREAGVKHVVNLSCMGAHMPERCGPASGLHFVEKALDELDEVHVLHLRPGLFFSDFLEMIDAVKLNGVFRGNYGCGTKLPLASPEEVAGIAYTALQSLSFRGKQARYVVSDEKTTEEIAAILGAAIGIPGLEWVDQTDEEMMRSLMQSGMSEEAAMNSTELGAAIRRGEMQYDYLQHPPARSGTHRFEEFAPLFAALYRRSSNHFSP